MKIRRGAVVGGLLLLFVLASGAGWPAPADVSASATLDPCRRVPTGSVIGKVIEVLHGDITIGRKYVGAAPFDIRSGVQICTDANGQLIFTLTRPRGSIACNTLPGSRLVATTTDLRFAAGTSWCFVQGAEASFSGAGSTTAQPAVFTAVRNTLFGISIRPNAVVVKVSSGGVSVSGSTIRESKQATLAYPRTQSRLALTAEDRSSVAELSAALAKEP